MKTASQETDRLAQLASDLLLIASSDQGALRLRPERLLAREVLASVRGRFAWRAEAESRRLVLDAPEDLTVQGDRIRLEQALGNMLDNALRHGAGIITLAAAASNGGVELHVRDEGPGFSPDLLAHAFERFSRAQSARNGGGAGLGLSIVETIAVAHGGRAAVCSGSSGGADVVVHVPPVNARRQPRRATSFRPTGRTARAPAGPSQLR